MDRDINTMTNCKNTCTKKTICKECKDSNSIKKKNLKILIVDDDSIMAEQLKEILCELWNHEVITVDEGSRCISHIYDNEYDLVLMDYMMDGLNGPETAKIIKNFKNCPLIFGFTGYSTEEALKNCQQSEMDGVIFKPIDNKKLDIISLLISSLETKNNINKIQLREMFNRKKKDICIFD
jgi:CheY-like chemotaxis protein